MDIILFYFYEGKDAYAKGIDDNPYNMGSQQWYSWRKGWTRAACE